MDLELKGKHALVTGSTAGIGFAIAKALAREGARVIVNGRTQSGVDRALSMLTAKNKVDVIGFAGDLATADAAERVVREHPDIEILVNNLGIFEPKPFEEISDDEWRRFFEVNVLSGVRLARLVLPGMKKRNSANRRIARTRRSRRGDRHYREQRAARSDAIARRRRFRRSAGEIGRQVVHRVRKDVLYRCASYVIAEALCDA